MPSLTQFKTILLASTVILMTLSIASADSLTVANPNFSAVAVQCSGGAAYQSDGGNCDVNDFKQQPFNTSVGIGWQFAAVPYDGGGDGLTEPNSFFEPPPFTGFPFSQAAYLQGPNAEISQTLAGFVPGGQYTLSFYLGSRYASGGYDGNQTVEAMVDGQVIGTWALVSDMPFTLQTTPFTVGYGGLHTVKFAGTVSGDHTAFFSGVSINAASTLTVSPASGVPDISAAVSAGGFAPFEGITLYGYGYGSTPAAIGAATAGASGNAVVFGRILQTPFGAYGLQAVGSISGAVASGIMSISPELVVSPKTGTNGGNVTAIGLGFAAGEVVSLTWLSPSTLLGSSKAYDNGTFPALTVAIPAGAPVGTNTVIATGRTSGASTAAQITVQ